MSRAERRHRTEKVIKARAKNLYKIRALAGSWGTFYNNIKEGVHEQWVKHTGTICSCSLCKRPRYSKKDRKENK